MSLPRACDIDALTTLLRAEPTIHDVALVTDEDQVRTVAVVVPQGYQPGAALRERVFELAGQVSGQPVLGSLEVLLAAAVPRDAAGRVDAAGVLDALAQPDALVYRLDSAGTDTERRLLDLVGDVLPGVLISVTDSLTGLGADSVVVMALVGRIEEELGLDMDPQEVFGAASLRELAATMDTITSEAAR